MSATNAIPSITPHHARLRTDTLAASVVILLVVTLVQRSVGFGRGILFCRWLSPETLGQWEMAYSFLLLFAPLAVLGIPGSYGRYLEHYRQRGQLRTFLKRTSIWTVICSTIAIGALVLFAPWWSQLVFGESNQVGLIYALSACLATVIFHHTLTSLLTAMRLFRLVSAMNFAQSLLFAASALGFLYFHSDVIWIVSSYGIASLVSSLIALAWVWPALRTLDQPTERLPQSAFWTRLLRFAFFVWVTNLLSHLFAVVDRYMLVHWGGMDPVVAMEQVGHYHSSRIVPLLLISFADLLSGLIMPHLSHDWESGQQKQVGNRLRLSVKLTGLGMLAFGVCVLLFSPLLFDVILQGRYGDGMNVLPWTLSGCVLYGVFCIAQNYLWCAERPRLTAVPLAIGLVANVVLNLILVPQWGLMGAVVATAISTMICLASVLVLSKRHGMPLDTGIWLAAFAPLSLGFGTSAASATLGVLIVFCLTNNWFLNREEMAELRQLFVKTLARWRPATGNRVPAGNV